MYSTKKFFKQLLIAGDWPSTRKNLNALLQWSKCEGTSARFNPLATTQPMTGATDFNTAHVKNYVDFEQGVEATRITITNRYYPHIVQGLKDGDLTHMIRSNKTAREELNTWGSGGDCVVHFLGGVIN